MYCTKKCILFLVGWICYQWNVCVCVSDPLQSVLHSLERRHEEEKRSALERQRLMYEQELQQLRKRLSTELQTQGSHPQLNASLVSSQSRLRQWSEERCMLGYITNHRKYLLCVFVCQISCFCGFREVLMNRSLRKLKEQIVKANLLVQEAGFIAEELNKKTEYKVTLQIPAANLNANRKVRRDALCVHVTDCWRFIRLYFNINVVGLWCHICESFKMNASFKWFSQQTRIRKSFFGNWTGWHVCHSHFNILIQYFKTYALHFKSQNIFLERDSCFYLARMH